jgi:hypothetical protein
MEKTKQRNQLLELFRSNVQKTTIAVPKQDGPTAQFFVSRVERYYR